MTPIQPPYHGSGPGSQAHGGRSPAAILERLRQIVLPRLELACGEALSKADDSLFDLAQNARNNTVRESYFDAMREIRRERRQIESRFHDEIVAGFVEFQRPEGMAPVAPPPRRGDELSLVDQDELEEQLAAEQSATTIHRRFKTVLEPIARGMARLAVAPAHNAELTQGPIAPEHLTRAFRKGCSAFRAATEVKLVLFKLYERELLPALDALYPEALRLLSETGCISGPTPRIPAPPAAPLPRTLPPDFNLEQVPQRQRAHEPVYDGNQEPDDNLMGNLQELLQVWRKVQRRGEGGTIGGPGMALPAGMAVPQGMAARPEFERPQLSSNEMLSVLSLFQTDLPDGLRNALKAGDHSLAQQLKREVLTGAAALGISKGDARLGDAEEDAIDVVGMMFEVFLDERDIKTDMRDKIARLLVPYIKVALLDRRLFLHKQHPARRLLNAIAEACEGNHGEGPHERELLERVGRAVDRLVAEFNEDIAIFELLEQELRTFIEQYRRRADLAERRVAEAQRGKERLDEARLRAESLLAERVDGRSIAPLALEDLRRYWAHHYAVLFLREGADGDGCALALRTLERMLALADVAFHTGGLTAAAETESLQPGLLAMLGSSGLTGEAAAECARGIAQHLMQPPARSAPPVVATPPERVAPAATPAAAAASVPAGATPATTDGAPANAPKAATARPLPEPEPPAPPLDVDPADVAMLRQLTVGSWVEFVGDDDRAQPGKLSWISPISARMLFVNKRGARMHVASAEELAAMMKQGKLRLRVADTAFDQAMHQVLGRLRDGATTASE